MKAKPGGLFWDNEDPRFTKRKEVLADHGWFQVEPGWWAESHLVNTARDVRDIALPVDMAYRLAINEKAEPPEPVWLLPSYLPGLDESKLFNVQLFTDAELIEAANDTEPCRQHELIFDIECYANYFLIAFMSLKSKRIVYFEFSNEQTNDLQHAKLRWILANFCIIGFNSKAYDVPMLSFALHGLSTQDLKIASDLLIKHKKRPYEVAKIYKCRLVKCNHIDLVDPAPGVKVSLKIYGGRLHSQKMQDLPFHPDTVLSVDQMHITRFYCVNDLIVTLNLKLDLLKELSLRESMSKQYNTDLRSKSDAQIAETVIKQAIQKSTGNKVRPPTIPPGTKFNYKVPMFIDFKTEQLKDALYKIKTAPFIVAEHGGVIIPDDITGLHINIGESVYRMGIGGLHSWEKSISHYSDDECFLVDRDVASYYPAIVLNLGLYPKQLGSKFLSIYNDIVQRRLKAKAEKNKTVADSLKITINGTFGKLGSKYSILYSPDLLIQVTMTGQLSLLMLIERLELANIPVVSANTDGIVIKCPYIKQDEMNLIVTTWEAETQFETEATYYSSLHSRDVNNYIAIKSEADDDGTFEAKTKGVFADSGLRKSPQNEICVEAIKALLLNKTPIEQTIKQCTDITKFITIRTVNGGGVKIYGKGEPGLYLGKAIRWYYATDQVGKIVYASSGNTVSKTQGACPVMQLPGTLPTNIDYQWYIDETQSMLVDLGVTL